MGKILKLVAMVLLTVNINAFAQNEAITPYEEGREKLVAETFEKLMSYFGDFDKLKFVMVWKLSADSVNLEWTDPDVVEDFIIKFCDLEDVYPYKTAVKNKLLPIDLSIEFSEYVLQKWENVGKWYKEERRKLDALKTDLDKQRELNKQRAPARDAEE